MNNIFNIEEINKNGTWYYQDSILSLKLNGHRIDAVKGSKEFNTLLNYAPQTIADILTPIKGNE